MDPSKCRAIESSLWEIETLSSHYLSDVKKLVASFKKDFPIVETDLTEHFDQDYEEVFNSKIQNLDNSENEVAVNFIKSNELFENVNNQIWTLE